LPQINLDTPRSDIILSTRQTYRFYVLVDNLIFDEGEYREKPINFFNGLNGR